MNGECQKGKLSLTDRFLIITLGYSIGNAVL